MTTERNKDDKWISEIVGVFADPIIVFPGGWGDSLPDWLKGEITLERLIMEATGIKTGKMTATDAEVCAYLMTTSLSQPIDTDWTQIYLYIAGQVYERKPTKEPGATMPQDIKVDHLSNYQMQRLDHLRNWIYERRITARQERDRAGRRENKEAAAAEKVALQPAMFDL